MTPLEFKKFRKSLDLSVNQLSKILNINTTTIRRWEMEDRYKSARPPNPIACEVLKWIKDGKLKL